MKFKIGQGIECVDGGYDPNSASGHIGFIVGYTSTDYKIMFSNGKNAHDWFQNYDFKGLEIRFEPLVFGDPVYD